MPLGRGVGIFGFRVCVREAATKDLKFGFPPRDGVSKSAGAGSGSQDCYRHRVYRGAGLREFRLAMRDRCICSYALNNGQITRILDQNTKKVRTDNGLMFRCLGVKRHGQPRSETQKKVSSEWAGCAIRVVKVWVFVRSGLKEYPTFPSHFVLVTPTHNHQRNFYPTSHSRF